MFYLFFAGIFMMYTYCLYKLFSLSNPLGAIRHFHYVHSSLHCITDDGLTDDWLT
jgi:hypothetical protein